MSSKKGLGETVLGWFVVREEDGQQPEATTEELLEKYEKKGSSAAAAAPAPARGRAPAAPPPLPAPTVKLNSAVPKIVAGSTPTSSVFAQVYRSAEIDDAEQERVEKALTLLQSLPTETPKEIKKQIVEASMKAFGIPVDQIIETGAQQIQALDAFIKHGEQQTQSVLSDASARVIKLNAEIAEIKKLMELQVGTQESLTRA
ncbi:MAG: hypothetical protein ABI134_16470, partial [Byssovorax sp.]